MKQHVSIEQLKKLTPNQLLILGNFVGYVRKERTNNEKTVMQEYIDGLAEYLTIGKMIEVLGTKINNISLGRRFGDYVEVSIKHSELHEFMLVKTFQSEELCDALFEALRYVLK